MIKKAISGIYYSWDGLLMTIRSEASFRYELFLFSILVPIAFLVGGTITEKLLLIFPLFFILMAELLNTGLEKLVDHMSQGVHHHTFKFIKDAGSAAVFMGFILLMLSWGMIIFPKLMA